MSPPPAPSRDLSYAWTVAGLLGAANLVSFMDRGILNLLVEPMRQDLDLTDTEISLLQGIAFVLFYSLVAVPIGRLADRGNRVRIITAGIFFWSLATTACGLARSYTQLFLARMSVGLGEATLPPAAVSIITDLFPRHILGRAVALFTAIGTVGGSLALILGGLLFDVFSAMGDVTVPVIGTLRPWQMSFIAISLPGFFIGLAMLFVTEPVRELRPAPVAAVERQEVSSFLWQSRRSVLVVILGFALVSCGQAAAGAWLPTFFIRSHEATTGTIGPILGAIQLACGLGGVLAGGTLTDLLRRRGYEDANLRAGLWALAVAAPCGILMPLVDSMVWSLVLWVPTNFAMMVCFGAATPAFPLVVPARMRSQVVALYLLMGNLLGLGTGPTLVALITDFVFADPLALKYALSIAAAIVFPLAFLCLAWARPAFTAQVARMRTADA